MYGTVNKLRNIMYYYVTCHRCEITVFGN